VIEVVIDSQGTPWSSGGVGGRGTAAPARQRLLAAAERLLLESGYDAVSVRAINAAAGMNPAAVHYHFGSKEALVAALLEESLAPLWEGRLADLTERRGTGWTPSMAELAGEVVIGPLAELAADPAGRLRLHLLARMVLGRRPLVWQSPWFGYRPWIELLRAARPDLSKQEARRRWVLAFDLVLHTVGDPMAEHNGLRDLSRTEIRSLTAFVTAGLDAP
jgi:AcrR family transcriptional regulator